MTKQSNGNNSYNMIIVNFKQVNVIYYASFDGTTWN